MGEITSNNNYTIKMNFVNVEFLANAQCCVGVR